MTGGHENLSPKPDFDAHGTKQRARLNNQDCGTNFVNHSLQGADGGTGGDSVRAHTDEAFQPMPRPKPGINGYYPVLLVP